MKWEARIVAYKGECRIAVYFEQRNDVVARMRALSGARFSYSLGAWHLPDTAAYRQQFKIGLPHDELLVTQMNNDPDQNDEDDGWYLQTPYEGRAEREPIPEQLYLNQIDWNPSLVGISVRERKEHLEAEDHLATMPSCKLQWYERQIPDYARPNFTPAPKGRKPQLTPKATEPAGNKHLEKIEAFKRWLRSKRYSESTIGTYADALKSFLVFYNHKEVNEITNDDVIGFNNDYILKYKLSASFQNQIVNAIKLFFRTIEDRRIDIDLVHRPKRSKLLPNVLSKEEVKQLLSALRNLKHRTMLALIYSCGLRRGELLSLKPTDVDSIRNIIVIRQAKGRKDRVVPLSEKVLGMLREYYKFYKPQVWLFEGQEVGMAYDERSLASVLKLALSRTSIQKPVTLHWLRHSYATHLLEAGTDLRYIQEILGHRSSRTTEIYTHVSAHNIQKIKSPFDDLDL